jgi:protein gp37
MGKHTNISYCHHTFNPVIGCNEVSAGCAHCFAKQSTAARVARSKGIELWSKDGPRQRTSAAYWRQPLAWDRAAAAAGERRRVLNTLCDPLDPAWPIDVLADYFDLIRRTENLDWLLLTKRPELWSIRLDTISELVGSLELYKDFRAWLVSWLSGAAPANVWIGATVEHQPMADKRIPELLKIPARVRFLSCEPLLGPINLEMALEDFQPLNPDLSRKPAPIQWVICGGESGPHARPMHPDWARSLRDQCKAAGVPFFFKQWGEWLPDSQRAERMDITDIHRLGWGLLSPDGQFEREARRGYMPPTTGICRVGKARAGHLLDGVEILQIPKL